MDKEHGYTLIVLPGIGGHPRFHAYIIEELKKISFLTIKAFPHGDFNRESFTAFTQHVTYWDALINQELIFKKKVGVLGISYGTAIIQSLPESTLSQLSFILLLSPVVNNLLVKTAITFIGLFNSKSAARAFGKLMFWWSLRSVEDKTNLLAMRKELYDDHEKVYLRLWKRFLAIKSVTPFHDFLSRKKEVPLKIVFGKKEILHFFISKPQPEQTKTFSYTLIEGRHSQLINPADRIVDEIKKFTTKIYGEDI